MTNELDKEQYSSMVNHNTILLSLEGWIKYIEGFTKGLQTTDTVNSAAVLDCVGEILEFMTTFKHQISKLLLHCEKILQENETKDASEVPMIADNQIQSIETDKEIIDAEDL